ncbi:TadE family protein [Sphingomonas sp. LY160]|uniref:TadE/TadG family type IV pilus assembly protein n=1 Tax=Sphingomonas sp. LY160 TaxID=3095342 RepID=UPI002ADEA824|nr:TadE family protein [Sphingomonas sp. LY160]MEA1072510.1 TadE family protein [Sphingomonas sp. LY160]
MKRRARLSSDRRGAAAAEMALVTPLLLVILFGSVELGNYFYNEHIVMKAVRDGARFAARQNFSNFSCSGVPGGTIEADTKALVMTSLLSGGTNRLPSWNATTVTLDTSCAASATDLAASTENLSGIYRGRTTGAPIVTVRASVPYVPLVGSAFGFRGTGLSLNASQQAAVMGL